MHRSGISTFDVATPKTNSKHPCPENYTPIDTSNSGFCIETFEHQNASKVFITNVTRDSAKSICNSYDSDDFDFELCSKDQWERACDGDPEPEDLKHRFGIQSVRDSIFLSSSSADTNLSRISSLPSILQNSCNQGTGDDEMAKDYNLRNPQCVTNEGVYDLAGNYSEWVSDTSALLFKGGNYLKSSNLSPGKTQSMAECSKNHYPKQNRPVFLDSCTGNYPMVKLIFSSPGSPDSLVCIDKGPKLDSLRVDNDTTKVKMYLSGGKKVERLFLRLSKTDTINKIPNSISMTDTALLVVVVVPDSVYIKDFDFSQNKELYYLDTLNYYDFRNSADPINTDKTPSDHPILQNEINSNWKIIPFKKLFGAIKSVGLNNPPHSKPAKPYYSHPIIGFRCCSKAVEKDTNITPETTEP